MALLNIVGCGKAGSALAALWLDRGVFDIGTVINRSLHSSRSAITGIGSGTAGDDVAAMPVADYIMIGTPDDDISSVAAVLGGGDCDRPDVTIFHLSGALPSSLLRDAGIRRAMVASCHPLQSFSSTAGAHQPIDGGWCGFEGEPEAVASLKNKFGAVGYKPFDIAAEHKLAYHAACVMASNYLNGLIHSAIQSCGLAGIAPATALQIIQPLVRDTLENIFASDPGAALTGPISRGDADIVSRQMVLLTQTDPGLATVYQALGQETLDLAISRGGLDDHQIDALRQALQG